MKTSRLALRANSCGDAYPRVFASETSRGYSLVRSIKNATKHLSVAFCTWGIALSAVSSAITLSWNKNPEADVNNYRLTYGTSSGNLNNEVNAGSNLSVSLNSLQAGTLYYFAVAAVNSSGQRSQPSAVISYQVPSDPGTTVYVIPTSGWSLKSVSSQETQGEDGASANAFDGNPNTFWHSQWSPAAQPPPHEIQIDLGSTRPVSGFRYLPRQDGGVNGNIGQYEFYVSTNGSTWGLPVATGNFANSASEKQVLFTEKSGRYVRFRALSDASGNSFACVAELTILQNEPIVVPVNQTPVANAGSSSTMEDTPVAVSLSASDPDGDPLTYVIVNQPSKGGLSGTAPDLTYTPAPNSNGSDSFTFRVNDGKVNSNTATVSISVTPVNDAPVVIAKSATTSEGTPVSVVLSGSDLEGSPLTYSIVSGPSKGSLSGNAPNLTYTPNGGVSGSDSFTYRAYDGSASSNTATVSITINRVNHAPVASSNSVGTQEDTPVSITLSASDSDGDSLGYVIVNGPSKGGFTGTAPNLTYMPSANFNGQDSFTFRANDGSLNSNIATVVISVSPVNDPPVAAARSATTAEGTPVSIVLSAFDVEGSTLSYAIVSGPGKGSLSGSAPNLTYTPAAGQSGPDSFTYRANDGSLNSNIATVSINISSVNHAPVADSGPAKTAEDESVAIQLSASDPDGDSLTYAIVGQPSKGSLSGSGRNRTYTPNKDFNGSDSFTFRANDGSLNSNVATVSISVTPVNDAPVASSGSAVASGDSPVAIKLVASDKDGDSLKYTIVSAPTKGVLSGNEPNLTYTPSAGSSGEDSFTFKVSDGELSSNTAKVSITNTPTNRAPVADSKSLTTKEDQAVAAVLSARDPDGDKLTYKIVSGPAHGSLTGTAPNMNYVPAAKYSGPDSFSYKVNDGKLDSKVATVSITVTKTETNNRPPVFVKNPMTFRSGKERKKYLGQTLAEAAVDPDEGALLVFSKVSGPAWLRVLKSGKLSGTPNSGSKGMNTFVVRVTDEAGEFAEASLNINVLSARLPLPWLVKLFGRRSSDKSASFAGGEFRLAGSGRLSGASDAGCFTYQTLTGDGSIIARVRSVDRAIDASRAGLMIRDSLAANSRHVFVGESGKGGMNWVTRKQTGGEAVSKSAHKTGRGSTWLRIVRKGETITGYQRVSNSKWKRIGAITLDINKNCYIGLFASGGNRKSSEAKFRNVKVDP